MIFETNNTDGVLALLEQKKIKIIPISKNNLTLKQSLQCPRSLQSQCSKGFSDADIDKIKSAMSVNDHLPKAKCWDMETQEYIYWFKAAPRIIHPFRLENHRQICMPEKFYGSIERDIETGPSGPRVRYGALTDDLKKLKIVMDGFNTDRSADNLPF